MVLISGLTNLKIFKNEEIVKMMVENTIKIKPAEKMPASTKGIESLFRNETEINLLITFSYFIWFAWEGLQKNKSG